MQDLDASVTALRRALANFSAGQKALMIALAASKKLAAERTQVCMCMIMHSYIPTSKHVLIAPLCSKDCTDACALVYRYGGNWKKNASHTQTDYTCGFTATLL